MRRILVADDDEALREALIDVLTDEHTEVHVATDGHQALALTLELQPDLLLLDHRMPAMNGLQVFLELKQRGVCVPVVMMTAAREIIPLARQAGLAIALQKPFTIDELLAAVDVLAPLSPAAVNGH